MRIVITGASGLLGRQLIQDYAKTTHEIVGVYHSRIPDWFDSSISSNITFKKADLRELHELEALLENCDVLVHSAGYISFNERERNTLLRINHGVTRDLVNLAIESGLQKLVLVSSVAALGAKRSAKEVGETARWENAEKQSIYGVSKYLGELEVWRGIEEGLQASIVNPSVILGPSDWNSSSTVPFVHVFKENRFYVDGQLNYVDVHDVAGAIMRLAANKESGERYILSAGRVSYKSLFDLIARVSKKRPPSIEVPRWLLRVLAPLSYIFALVSGKPNRLSSDSLKTVERNVLFDGSKAQRRLDLKYRSIEDSVGWVCEKMQ